jgi:cytochrome d ubiquinol oxidase subunit I
MEVTALLLSRLQFAFTISFHIIFPSFSIGLAAWLTILEALYQATGRSAYRVVFEFWLKIFSVAFGMGVVSGIVMAFQFGTNWEVLARMVGPIQCPPYETFTAFFLEASFFGILCSGAPACRRGSICSRPRWSRSAPRCGLLIMANSWMQALGCVENGASS